MKKVLALILVLLMAMSVFVACGDKSEGEKGGSQNGSSQGGGSNVVTAKLTDEELIGNWKLTVGLNNVLAAQIESESESIDDETLAMIDMYKEMFEGLDFEFILKFKEGGKYDVSISKESLESIMNNMVDNILGYLKNGGLEKVAAMQGMDISQLESQVEAAGMTMDTYYEFMAEAIKENLPPVDTMFQGEKDLGVDENGNNYVHKDGEYKLTETSFLIDMDNTTGISSDMLYTYDGVAVTFQKNVEGKTHFFTGCSMTKY